MRFACIKLQVVNAPMPEACYCTLQHFSPSFSSSSLCATCSTFLVSLPSTLISAFLLWHLTAFFSFFSLNPWCPLLEIITCLVLGLGSWGPFCLAVGLPVIQSFQDWNAFLCCWELWRTADLIWKNNCMPELLLLWCKIIPVYAWFCCFTFNYIFFFWQIVPLLFYSFNICGNHLIFLCLQRYKQSSKNRAWQIIQIVHW